MSDINISHSHCYDKITACKIAEEMTDDLAKEYGLTINSNGEGHIDFSGSGISGSVTIDDDIININAQLGFLMSAMKPVITTAIESKLQKKFS